MVGHNWHTIYNVIFNWLRERDLNPRPSGYEPDELPTAPSRDNFLSIHVNVITVKGIKNY